MPTDPEITAQLRHLKAMRQMMMRFALRQQKLLDDFLKQLKTPPPRAKKQKRRE